MKIIVTGSLAFDFIMDFPGKFSDHILPEKIHKINLSFLVNKMSKQRGGTAGNIAYNLALLGIKPTILATAGNDFAEYKKFLEDSGVDTTMIYIIEAEPTASAFIFTDMVDNQITGFYPGAMEYAKGLSLKKLGGLAATNFSVATSAVENNSRVLDSSFMHNGTRRGKCGSSKIVGRHPLKENVFVVISPNEPSAMIKFAKECQKLGIPYVFDPGMQLPRLTDSQLREGIEEAKVVIGNDYEIALIRNRFRESIGQTISQVWITTLGEEGSIIESGGKTYKIPPAKPKEVLDPTGAGDAYRAGFLAGFARGFSLDICGRMGSVCSVYTVEKYGTTTHSFSKAEFLQRYQENFSEKLLI